MFGWILLSASFVVIHITTNHKIHSVFKTNSDIGMTRDIVPVCLIYQTLTLKP